MKPASPQDRLIVALDVETLSQAEALVTRLKGLVSTFKVGAQLYTAHGPRAVRVVQEHGGRVFLDLKFHDIPAVTARAAVEAARLGVFMFTVHAAGGLAMMERCKEALFEFATRERQPAPLVVAVTVLTSLQPYELVQDLGVTRPLPEQVRHLANLAQAAGVDGVVTSPRELALLRESCGPDFLLVVPGIRAEGVGLDDQKRTATAAQAVADGADYLVVGRPILRAPDPVEAAAALLDAMA